MQRLLSDKPASIDTDPLNLWLEGSDVDRIIRSLNAFREETSSDSMPRIVCGVCGELHPEEDVRLIGTTAESHKALRRSLVHAVNRYQLDESGEILFPQDEG